MSRRFGQHFLIDQPVIQAILSAVNAANTPPVPWIEIGPGKGALTWGLLEGLGALKAIEVDHDLIRYWQQQAPAGLEIIAQDALTVDYQSLAKENQYINIVGNLPYNVSTALMQRWFAQHGCWKQIIVMVQKEVANRLTAAPGDKKWGLLSVQAQLVSSVVELIQVPPSSFKPPPKVDSTVLRFDAKPTLLPLKSRQTIMHLAAYMFKQRRKSISNSLGKLLDVERIERCGIDPNVRAESIGIPQLYRLAQEFDQNPS